MSASDLGVEDSLFRATVQGDTISEIAFVFISSGGCGACADPELPALVQKAADALAETAKLSAVSYATIGVGLDRTPSDGWTDLERFGRFDEMLIGRGSSSVGGLVFLWGQYAGPSGVPQALVLLRRFAVTGDRLAEVDEGRILGRYVGVAEISRWADRGYAIEMGR
jgi:hypothetical protein